MGVQSYEAGQDKIINEIIWWTTKVGDIANEVQERRLKWHGEVMRSE